MKVLHTSDRSAEAIQKLISSSSSDVVFVGDPNVELQVEESSLRRMSRVLEVWGAGIVYSDAVARPRADYQFGSIRDDFEFGPLVALSVPLSREAYRSHGLPETDLRWGALYDLRLKLSIDHPVVRIPEPLYSAKELDSRSAGERHFDYVDSSNRDYQVEMERVATGHLRRIGAHLEDVVAKTSIRVDPFPATASIVIPVRNREKTLSDALGSALEQETDFAFNVIVVDNHSTDSTGWIIEDIKDARLVHLIPERTDLGIGGCWNEAIRHPDCGRFALQLDSDDLFSGKDVLARVVREMARHRYAMLVGSYTTVDFSLRPTSPGLVDHREWTRQNGPNNALRVNGFGAPRAYDVAVARRFGFPNVSYGEDYAMGLRMCREYEIGRMFDSLYHCRRWEGNTDSAPPIEVLNRYNGYKDWVRTNEIRARVALNRECPETGSEESPTS
jgi:hypothetical protein